MTIVLRCIFALLITLGLTPSFGQSARSSAVKHSATATRTPVVKSQLKIVAGIVEQGGTVRYLPRVEIRVFSQKYADAERTATAAYSSEIERLRQTRDAKYKNITDQRRSELQAAETHYDEQVRAALASFKFDPADGTPTCASFVEVLQSTELCSQYSIGQKLQLSSQLRKWLVNPALIGSFDPQTFKAAKAPYALNQRAALLAVPLNDYEQVPEFRTQIGKALEKERSQTHTPSGVAASTEVQLAAVTKFIDDWNSAARKRSYLGKSDLAKFGYVSFDFISTAHKELEKSAQLALRKTTDPLLLAYMTVKDEINAKYDSQQAAADAEFQGGTKSAEDHRSALIDAAAKATPPVATTATSLQGDTEIALANGTYTLYGEDTTTDHHYRWALPVSVRTQSQTLELTDANALKASPETVASAAAQPTYPKASELTATQSAEYDLRYGSKLLRSWSTVCTSKTSHADERLMLHDSPLGFGFLVMCTSDNVFNTLRMNDNDIAARTFRDYVAPYLRELPADLKSAGGSQAFETVSVDILASSKSFADEYAVGNNFWLDYVFRLADVESFASQKIDAQQLLDRGHITNDRIGRITVKLVGAN